MDIFLNGYPVPIFKEVALPEEQLLMDGHRLTQGSRVWSFRHKWGTVTHLYGAQEMENTYTFRVEVAFSNGLTETYTFCSMSSDPDIRDMQTRDLFWDEIRFVPPPKPVEIVKQRVLVRPVGGPEWDWRIYPAWFTTLEQARAVIEKDLFVVGEFLPQTAHVEEE